MRKIDLIVIHCSATREDQHFTETMLEECHRDQGLDGCGYHFYVRRDGHIAGMRPLKKAGAHAKGYNAHSIGIAYEGGLDSDGKPKDTRTSWQRHSLQVLVKALLMDYPGSRVVGHRDLSPDLNGDGRVTLEEWVKQCPCFDAKTLMKD
jgi:N-acetylmuramoyl-L-alanine amidase